MGSLTVSPAYDVMLGLANYYESNGATPAEIFKLFVDATYMVDETLKSRIDIDERLKELDIT